MRVSHESIYRDVYMPSRKVFDASMFHRLRSDRSIRRPRGKQSSYGRGQIRNMVSIRERPTEADTRQVAGVDQQSMHSWIEAILDTEDLRRRCAVHGQWMLAHPGTTTFSEACADRNLDELAER
jgi:hypothetical protein